MVLKVAVIQNIPNYKQDTTPKDGSRKKEKSASFKEILNNAMKK